MTREPTSPDNRIVSFRAPTWLVNRLERAAERAGCTLSDILRAAADEYDEFHEFCKRGSHPAVPDPFRGRSAGHSTHALGTYATGVSHVHLHGCEQCERAS